MTDLHDELLLPVEIMNALDRPASSVYLLIKMKGFPDPIFDKKGVRMWRKSDVLAWKRANDKPRKGK